MRCHDVCMTYTSSQKKFFANQAMLIYGDYSVAPYVLSLYILAVFTIITYVTWLVYLQKNKIYNHFWTLHASTHE